MKNLFKLFVHGYKPAYNLVPCSELIGTSDPLTFAEQKRFLVLFQKMCVLDYVIRNTDRTMDNWLIRLGIHHSSPKLHVFNIFFNVYFKSIIKPNFRHIPDETLDIAAIDNGLAFPVKHPETATVLRPFLYGWANLDSAREA